MRKSAAIVVAAWLVSGSLGSAFAQALAPREMAASEKASSPSHDAAPCERNRTLPSPDGLAIAKVSTVNTGQSCGESSIDVEVDGHVLATIDLRSQYGWDGYGVRSAIWTPDSQYFVFDAVNAGGHQPMSSPIFIFLRSSGKIGSLPLPSTISSSFELLPGDRLKIQGWNIDKQADTTLEVDLTGRTHTAPYPLK